MLYTLSQLFRLGSLILLRAAKTTITRKLTVKRLFECFIMIQGRTELPATVRDHAEVYSLQQQLPQNFQHQEKRFATCRMN